MGLRQRLPSVTARLGDRHVALTVGVALMVAGAFVMWDATERQGQRPPILLRPLVPF